MYTVDAVELFCTKVQVEVGVIGFTEWLKRELYTPSLEPVYRKPSIPLFAKQAKRHDENFLEFMQQRRREQRRKEQLKFAA